MFVERNGRCVVGVVSVFSSRKQSLQILMDCGCFEFLSSYGVDWFLVNEG